MKKEPKTTTVKVVYEVKITIPILIPVKENYETVLEMEREARNRGDEIIGGISGESWVSLIDNPERTTINSTVYVL